MSDARHFLLVNTAGSFGYRITTGNRTIRPLELGGLTVRRARPLEVDEAWLQTNIELVTELVDNQSLQVTDMNGRQVDVRTLVVVGPTFEEPVVPVPRDDRADDPVFHPIPSLGSPNVGFAMTTEETEEAQRGTPELLDEVVNTSDTPPVAAVITSSNQDPAALRRQVQKGKK